MLPFTANATTTTLKFESQDGAGSAFGPVIGNVNVSAVPGPVTLVLVGAGLLGLGALRSRRKAKA